MALRPGVQVEGERELRRALKQIDADLVKGLKPVHQEAAQVVEGPARGRFPTRSGALAGSVTSKGTTSYGYVRAGSSAVPYAGPIEFGWPARGIEGVHAILEAMDEQQPEVIHVYEAGIDELVRAAGLD